MQMIFNSNQMKNKQHHTVRTVLIYKIVETEANKCQEEFQDTKWVNRIGISKKNRQHNGHKKKDKRANNELQNIHIKLKI